MFMGLGQSSAQEYTCSLVVYVKYANVAAQLRL